MADVVFVEDIHEDRRSKGVDTLHSLEGRVTALRLGLDTVNARQFGTATVIIEFDPPAEGGPEYLEVTLHQLAEVVGKIDAQHARIARPGTR